MDSFVIQFTGLLIPDEVRESLASKLRDVILSELGEAGIGEGLSVTSLPPSVKRMLPGSGPISGFGISKSVERRTTPTRSKAEAPSLGSTDRDELYALLGLGTSSISTAGDAQLMDLIEGVYYRPDFREACIAVTRALTEHLSDDPQAQQALRKIVGNATIPGADVPRKAVGLAVGVAMAGVGAGLVIAVIAHAARPQ
jgi:hypothetical protein